jgi:hypothetical protein
MTSQESLEQAERELAKVKGFVDEQYDLAVRLKRNGADTEDAVRLLIDLLELQQTCEQRLAQAQIHHGQLSGMFARRTLAANILASPRVNNFAADLRPGSSSK